MSKLSPALKKITTRNRTPLMLTKGRHPQEESIKLDAKREIAYNKLLLEGKSPATIAKEMNVGRNTIHEWLNHNHEKLKVSITGLANIRREMLTTLYDSLLEQYVPLALKDDLKVSGDKYGASGELKHIEIESWEASKAAADVVLKTAKQMGDIWGLNKTNVTVDLPKGTNINFPVAIFEVVKKAAESMKENTIEGEFTHENQSSG